MRRLTQTVPCLAALVTLVLASGMGACSSSSASEEEPASPCAAFGKPASPRLKADDMAKPARAKLVAIKSFGGRLYGLDADGVLTSAGDMTTAAASPRLIDDLAISKSTNGDVVAFGVRWEPNGALPGHQLVRLTSSDGGVTFPAASEKVLFTVASSAGASPMSRVAITLGPEGLLYLVIGAPAAVQAEPGLQGRILRLDVSRDTAAAAPGNAADPKSPEVWARTLLREPRGLDVDPGTGDVWVTDQSSADATTTVYRITRSSGDEIKPVLTFDAMERRPSSAGGHVYRGKRARSLVGKYMYHATGGLVTVDRFGPSGPPLASRLALTEDGPIGRSENGELVVATARGIVEVSDVAPPSPAPASLRETKCFDLTAAGGVVSGAIGYDLTAPLWSDGAAKERFVVVPKGQRLTSRPDGDLVFPVGTVAVKTFSSGGKRIETRLLVQHELESWVGYSYAWNEAGTDAELVDGNRVAALPGGKSWYFPSSTDCTACHTPAAGYTLGLEVKQLTGRGDALARLEARLSTPVDTSKLPPLASLDAPPPATPEARARSYLHANCSMCHREGSVTGAVVDLDLRFDTPLAKAGLCGEAKAGPVGIAGTPRIVEPRDPARSVLVARMRATDERRMPKLATHVVDEAGVAAVEAWISGMSACP